MKFYIGLIVGHDKDAQGSIAYDGVNSEYNYNRNRAFEIQFLQDNVDMGVFTKKGFDYSEIMKAYQHRKENGYIVVSIEMHCNSYNKVARGLEALCLEDVDNFENSLLFADIFTDAMSSKMGIRERRKIHQVEYVGDGDGVLKLSRKARGAACLRAVAPAADMAILYEPAFWNIKNPDSEKLFQNGGNFYSGCFSDSLTETLTKIKGLGVGGTPRLDYQEANKFLLEAFRTVEVSLEQSLNYIRTVKKTIS